MKSAIGHWLLIGVLGGAGVMFGLSASATTITPQSWEVASEFSDAANPAGIWSYGSKPTLNGAFTVMTNPVNAYSGTLKGWDTPASVTHNTDPFANTYGFGGGSVTFPPHALAMHPGASCEYSVVRFTAPLSGKYRITGQFYGIDGNSSGTITDVHIQKGPAGLFSGAVDVSTAPVANFQTSTRIKSDKSIDFEVGCGANGDYSFDTTGLNAVIVYLGP